MKPSAVVVVVALVSFVASLDGAQERTPTPGSVESAPSPAAFEPGDPAPGGTLGGEKEVPKQGGFVLPQATLARGDAFGQPSPVMLAFAPGTALTRLPTGSTALLLRPPWLAASVTGTVFSAGVCLAGLAILAGTSMTASLGRPTSTAELIGWGFLGAGVTLVGIGGILESIFWSFQIVREWVAPHVEASPAVLEVRAAPRLQYSPGALAIRF